MGFSRRLARRSRRQSPRRRRPRLALEPLESRVLLSADPLAALAEDLLDEGAPTVQEPEVPAGLASPAALPLDAAEILEVAQSVTPNDIRDLVVGTLSDLRETLEVAFATFGAIPGLGNSVSEGMQPFFDGLEDAEESVAGVFASLPFDGDRSGLDLVKDGLFQVFGTPGLDLLSGVTTSSDIGVQFGKDSDAVLAQLKTDLMAAQSGLAESDKLDYDEVSTGWVQLDLELGQTIDLASIPFDPGFDLGPALSLDFDGSLDLSFQWGLDLGIGFTLRPELDDDGRLQRSEQVFLDTSTDDELTGALVVELPGDGQVTVGFLQGKVDTTAYGADGIKGADENDPAAADDEASAIRVGAKLDVVDPDFVEADFDADDQSTFERLTISDIVDAKNAGTIRDVFTPKLDATAGLALHVMIGEAPSATSSASGFGLPSITFDFLTGATASKSFPSTDSSPAVFSFLDRDFENVRLDLGPIVAGIIDPVADVIGTVLGPILDVVGPAAESASGFLNAPIPLLEDVADLIGIDPPSLLDLSGNADAFNTFMSVLGNFQGFRKFLDGFDPTQIIQFPDITIDPAGVVQIPTTFTPPPGFTSAQEIQDLLASASTLKTSTVSVDKGGFEFPILEPSTIVSMLTGQPFTIVQYALPSFELFLGRDFGFDFEALAFNIKAGATVSLAKLAFGYDSEGLARIVEAARVGATPDFTDILDGFFIQTADGPELKLTLRVEGGGEVDVAIMSAFANAFLEGNLSFDVVDPSGTDGKLRLDEILELTDDFQDPGRIIELFAATAGIAGGFDFGGSLFGIEVSADDLGIPTNFDVSISLSDLLGYPAKEGSELVEPPPVLAQVVTMDGEEVLRLNAGAFASARLTGDTDDSGGAAGSADFEVSGTNGAFEVARKVGGVVVATQTVNQPVSRIVAVGGAGNDRFVSTASGVVVDFKGEGGNDTLTGAAADDRLDGGVGNDVLTGKGGDDTLLGGLGNDTLFGGAGRDLLEGGLGNDSLQAGAGIDVLLGGLGNDTLRGGGDADQLDGGSGGDDLAGGQGDDTLLGGSGADTLVGGEGADNLDGGSGDDDLSGGSGDDTLLGGLGDDTLAGGDDADRLEGNDGDDSLDGGLDIDLLLGGTGEDTLAGGGDADTLQGGADDDTLKGQFDDVRVEGGTGTDVFELTSAGGAVAGVTLDATRFSSSGTHGGIERLDVTLTANVDSITLDGLPFEVTLDLGASDDTVTVLGVPTSARPDATAALSATNAGVRIVGGSGTADKLVVRGAAGGIHAQVENLEVHATGANGIVGGFLDAPTGGGVRLGLGAFGEIVAPGATSVDVQLTNQDDAFEVRDNPSGVTTLVSGRGGSDEIRVVRSAGALTIRGGEGTIDPLGSGFSDRLTLAPLQADMPSPFGSITPSVERLRIDGSGLDAGAVWSVDRNAVFVGSTKLLDIGLLEQIELKGSTGVGDDKLQIEDAFSQKKLVTIEGRTVEIVGGLKVLDEKANPVLGDEKFAIDGLGGLFDFALRTETPAGGSPTEYLYAVSSEGLSVFRRLANPTTQDKLQQLQLFRADDATSGLASAPTRVVIARDGSAVAVSSATHTQFFRREADGLLRLEATFQVGSGFLETAEKGTRQFVYAEDGLTRAGGNIRTYEITAAGVVERALTTFTSSGGISGGSGVLEVGEDSQRLYAVARTAWVFAIGSDGSLALQFETAPVNEERLVRFQAWSPGQPAPPDANGFPQSTGIPALGETLTWDGSASGGQVVGRVDTLIGLSRPSLVVGQTSNSLQIRSQLQGNLVGATLQIVDGRGSGQSFTIQSHDNAPRSTIVINGTFSTLPDESSVAQVITPNGSELTVRLVKGVAPEEGDSDLNSALGLAPRVGRVEGEIGSTRGAAILDALEGVIGGVRTLYTVGEAEFAQERTPQDVTIKHGEHRVVWLGAMQMVTGAPTIGFGLAHGFAETIRLFHEFDDATPDTSQPNFGFRLTRDPGEPDPPQNELGADRFFLSITGRNATTANPGTAVYHIEVPRINRAQPGIGGRAPLRGVPVDDVPAGTFPGRSVGDARVLNQPAADHSTHDNVDEAILPGFTLIPPPVINGTITFVFDAFNHEWVNLQTGDVVLFVGNSDGGQPGRRVDTGPDDDIEATGVHGRHYRWTGGNAYLDLGIQDYTAAPWQLVPQSEFDYFVANNTDGNPSGLAAGNGVLYVGGGLTDTSFGGNTIEVFPLDASGLLPAGGAQVVVTGESGTTAAGSFLDLPGVDSFAVHPTQDVLFGVNANRGALFASNLKGTQVFDTHLDGINGETILGGAFAVAVNDAGDQVFVATREGLLIYGWDGSRLQLLGFINTLEPTGLSDWSDATTDGVLVTAVESDGSKGLFFVTSNLTFGEFTTGAVSPEAAVQIGTDLYATGTTGGTTPASVVIRGGVATPIFPLIGDTLVASPDGSTIYALDSASGRIRTYARNATSGQVSLLQTLGASLPLAGVGSLSFRDDFALQRSSFFDDPVTRSFPAATYALSGTAKLTSAGPANEVDADLVGTARDDGSGFTDWVATGGIGTESFEVRFATPSSLTGQLSALNGTFRSGSGPVESIVGGVLDMTGSRIFLLGFGGGSGPNFEIRLDLPTPETIDLAFATAAEGDAIVVFDRAEDGRLSLLQRLLPDRTPQLADGPTRSQVVTIDGEKVLYVSTGATQRNVLNLGEDPAGRQFFRFIENPEAGRFLVRHEGFEKLEVGTRGGDDEYRVRDVEGPSQIIVRTGASSGGSFFDRVGVRLEGGPTSGQTYTVEAGGTGSRSEIDVEATGGDATLVLDLQGGTNTVSVLGSAVNGTLRVDGGSGADTFRVLTDELDSDIVVLGKGGADELLIEGGSLVGGPSAGSVAALTTQQFAALLAAGSGVVGTQGVNGPLVDFTFSSAPTVEARPATSVAFVNPVHDIQEGQSSDLILAVRVDSPATEPGFLLFDLDGDGFFEDAPAPVAFNGGVSTLSVRIPFVDLETLGLADGPATFSIAAKAVTIGDDPSESSAATSQLRVSNVAPTPTATGSASAVAGDAYVLGLAAPGDPGPDEILSWTIDWGDGTPAETILGNPGSATHVFEEVLRPYEYELSGPANLIFPVPYRIDFAIADQFLPEDVTDTSFTVPITGTFAHFEGNILSGLDVFPDLPLVDATARFTRVGDGPSSTYSLTIDAGPVEITVPNPILPDILPPIVKQVEPDRTVNVALGQGALFSGSLGAPTLRLGTVSTTSTGGQVGEVRASRAPLSISASVRDDDGTYDASPLLVNVINPTPPNVVLDLAASEILEGERASVDVVILGGDGAEVVDIDWGDGTQSTGISAFGVGDDASALATHVYADDGVYLLTATVQADGQRVARQAQVTVQNVAPFATIGLGTRVDYALEGTFASDAPTGVFHAADATFDLTYSMDAPFSTGPSPFGDDGVAALSNSVGYSLDATPVGTGAFAGIFVPGDDDFGFLGLFFGAGGAFVEGDVVAGPGPLSNASPTAPGFYAGTFDVTGTVRTGSLAAPQADYTGQLVATTQRTAPSIVSEGQTFQIDLRRQEPGQDVADRWVIDWGDGTQDVLPGDATSASHAYADDRVAAYTISATIRDEDGTFDAVNTLDVTVADVAAQASAEAEQAGAALGDPFAIRFEATDPGADPVVQWVVNWGDGTTDLLPGEATGAEHVYLAPGSFSVGVIAVQAPGLALAAPVTVAVSDVVQQPGASAAGSVFEGAPYTVELATGDPRLGGYDRFEIDWGDGTSEAVAFEEWKPASGIPLAIASGQAGPPGPDGEIPVVSSKTTLEVAVADSQILADLDVELSIEHPRVGDLEVTLVHPDGTRVTLLGRGFQLDAEDGSTLDVEAGEAIARRLRGTVFDDEATAPVDRAGADLAGRFQPIGRLADFDGKDAQGTWTLEVVDSGLGAGGTITGLSLSPSGAARHVYADGPLSSADGTIVYQIDGTFDAAAPTTARSAPGDDFALRFEVPTSSLDGTFTAYFLDGGTSFGLLGEDAFVEAGDVTGDAVPDVVKWDLGGAAFQVFEGAGDGTFELTDEYTAPAGISSLALVDVDGNGVLDVVTAHASQLGVFLAQASGALAAAAPIASGGAGAVRGADVNGDARTDLVTVSFGSGEIEVLLQNADGSFAAPQAFLAGAGPFSLAIGDVDGGAVDLVVANLTDQTVTVHSGDGTGAFVLTDTLDVEGTPGHVSLGDLDLDGTLDIVVANQSEGVGVFLNDAATGFGGVTTFEAPVGVSPFDLRLADVDGDGRLDAVTGNTAFGGPHGVSIFRGDGSGAFATAEFSETPQGAAGSTPSFVPVADFDGDGLLDVATSSGFIHLGIAPTVDVTYVFGGQEETFSAAPRSAPGLAGLSLRGVPLIEALTTSALFGGSPTTGLTPEFGAFDLGAGSQVGGADFTGRLTVSPFVPVTVSYVASDQATQLLPRIDVAVGDRPPELEVSLSSTGRRNVAIAFDSLTDPGADTLDEILIDWGDGTSTQLSGLGGVLPDPATHDYSSFGSRRYDVRITLIDEDGTHQGPSLIVAEAGTLVIFDVLRPEQDGGLQSRLASVDASSDFFVDFDDRTQPRALAQSQAFGSPFTPLSKVDLPGGDTRFSFEVTTDLSISDLDLELVVASLPDDVEVFLLAPGASTDPSRVIPLAAAEGGDVLGGPLELAGSTVPLRFDEESSRDFDDAGVALSRLFAPSALPSAVPDARVFAGPVRPLADFEALVGTSTLGTWGVLFTGPGAASVDVQQFSAVVLPEAPQQEAALYASGGERFLRLFVRDELGIEQTASVERIFTMGPIEDADGDTVPDFRDNAVLVANPDQLDSDGDGWGNVIDGDFDDDGFVGIQDFSLFIQGFNQPADPTDPADPNGVLDMSGDGFIGIEDFSAFIQVFNQPLIVPGFVGSPPGPGVPGPLAAPASLTVFEPAQVEPEELRATSSDLSLAVGAEHGGQAGVEAFGGGFPDFGVTALLDTEGNSEDDEETEVDDGARVSSSAELGRGSRVAAEARVDRRAKLGERVQVGPRARVGSGSFVGDDVEIGEHSVVGRKVRIGADVRIGARVWIQDGANVPAGTVILDDSQVMRAAARGAGSHGWRH